MGCDIHAYVEYEAYKNREGKPVYHSFAERISLGRDYMLFYLLAGVRYSAEWMEGLAPVAQPKGTPNDMAYRTNDEYRLWVHDEGAAKEWERCVTRDHANAWVTRGVSHWLDESHVSDPDWHSASWLTVPELEEAQRRYSTHPVVEESWWTSGGTAASFPAEKQSFDGKVGKLAKVRPAQFFGGYEGYYEVGDRIPRGPNQMLAAVIAAMKSLDGDTPGKSRLVFWFDN